MERRKALAVAGAISASAMTAAVAIGVNFGLFGLAAEPATNVGNFKAFTAADTAEAAGQPQPSPQSPVEEIIVIEEEPAPVAPPAAPGPSASAPARPSDDGAAVLSSGSRGSDAPASAPGRAAPTRPSGSTSAGTHYSSHDDDHAADDGHRRRRGRGSDNSGSDNSGSGNSGRSGGGDDDDRDDD